MKINKKQLFKRAWDLAKNYSIFPKRAARDGVPIDPYQKDEDGASLEIHPSPFMPGYKEKMKFRRSIYGARVYFKYALRIVWNNMKAEEANYQRGQKKEKIAAKAAENQQNVPRELIPFGEYEIGDKLLGNIIVKIGKQFKPHNDMFSCGISPDTDYVAYAYFN